MMMHKRRGFKKTYAYGGTGIFDSLASFFTRLFTSNAAKQIASSTFDVGKSVAKEGAKKALEAGKSAAVDASTRLIKKALTSKSKKILRKYASLPEPQDTNAIIDGSGKDAIALEKIIKKLSKGSGIKTTKKIL